MSEISKQVIVVRKDLRNSKGEKLRSGKIAAQVAHASLKAIFDNAETKREYAAPIETDLHCDKIIIESYGGGPGPVRHALYDWLNGRFTKICVSVDSEQELLDIYNQAKDDGICCSLITDAGLTEFGGVPTITCCAIGPEWSDKIDKITGNLKLL